MDETEKNQDVETSGEETGTSETYTEEQITEIRRKAESDALSKAGRATAAAEKATKIANKAVADLKKAEERAYQRDRELYQEDPKTLSGLEAERRERDLHAELEEVEQKLSDMTELHDIAEEKVGKSTKERNAREIATRLNVDPNLLGRLSALTDGSTEAIEAEARLLPKLSQVPQIVSDSGRGGGVGSAKKPTLEELKASDPFETQKKVDTGVWVL
ncbi:hypothetical protein LCGC14_1955400 [marine sediment metagenome]|uniref:Uncharacterized protein n=1 Tax=marine sediment metagenome TaxID=412755 RepID=A0A0F9IDC7_9ZZZZ